MDLWCPDRSGVEHVVPRQQRLLLQCFHRALAAAWFPDAARPLAIFSICSGITHLMSALTHVWPDSHGLEKLDHLGIVVTIIGNPMSSLMVRLSACCQAHALPCIASVIH